MPPPEHSSSLDQVAIDRPKAVKPAAGGGDVVDSMREIMQAVEQHPLLRAFETMQGGDQAKSLAMLFLADKFSHRPEELHELRERASFILGLHGCMLKFAQATKGREMSIAETVNQVDALFDEEKVRGRRESFIPQNADARLFDTIVRVLDQDVTLLASAVPVSIQYTDASSISGEGILDRVGLINDVFLHRTEQQVNGFLDVVEQLRGEADAFPEHVRSIVQAVELYKTFLADRYGAGQDDNDEHEMRGRSLFELFGAAPPEKEDVPIYKENVHLTAFLHAIFKRIPTVQSESQRKKKSAESSDREKPYDAAEAKAFAKYLQSLGDKKLLAFVREGTFLDQVATVIEQLYHQFLAIQKAYDECGIERQKETNPDTVRLRSRNTLEKFARERHGKDERSLAAFDIQEPLELLRHTQFTKLPPPVQAQGGAVGKEARTGKEKKMLEIFDDIEHDLELLAEGKGPDSASDWDVDQWVDDLILMKHDMADRKQKRRRKTRMRLDRQRENFRFEARSAGVGHLELEQIPTTDETFDGIIGSGWKKVRARVEDVLRFSELEMVSTRMGPRRKMTAHTIVIGPYGCGKNYFSRALTSDPRVVGIETTVGSLLTAWAGESEANIGRLFRAAQKKRDLYERPAVIVADEFDAFFEAEAGGKSVVDSMLKRMRKELQTMLDGNVDYDGVFLFAMTNEPQHIPPEIYRRMGQERIFVIDELQWRERIQLMESLLAHIPLSDDFFDTVSLEDFADETENTSGDIIGKIAEYSYETFRKLFEKKHPKRIRNIEEEVRDLMSVGEKLTPKRKVAMFRKGAGRDVTLTPELFRLACDRVLQDPVTDGLRLKQKKFYEDVPDMLDAAFSDRPWPDPGFEPPSSALEP